MDGGGSGSAAALIAPGIFNGVAGTFDHEGHRFGDAVQCKVAGDLQFAVRGAGDRFRDKSHGRILGDLEKIVFQVFIARFIAGVDGGGVDGGVDHRFGEVSLVELHGAGDVGEFTLNFGNAEMTTPELGVGGSGMVFQFGVI